MIFTALKIVICCGISIWYISIVTQNTDISPGIREWEDITTYNRIKLHGKTLCNLALFQKIFCHEEFSFQNWCSTEMNFEQPGMAPALQCSNMLAEDNFLGCQNLTHNPTPWFSRANWQIRFVHCQEALTEMYFSLLATVCWNWNVKFRCYIITSSI